MQMSSFLLFFVVFYRTRFDDIRDVLSPAPQCTAHRTPANTRVTYPTRNTHQGR